MILSAFVEVLLPVAVVIALGYVLGRTFPLDARTLNRLSLYILSPCLMFVSMLRTDVAGDAALRMALQMLIVMAATTVCAAVAAFLFKQDTEILT